MTTEPFDAKSLIFKILELLSSSKLNIAFAGISLITVVFCMLSVGHIMRDFIDQPNMHLPLYKLITMIVIFGFASFCRSFFVNTVAEYAVLRAKQMAYEAVLSAHSREMHNLSFSDIAYSINSDSEQIGKIIIDVASFLIRNFITTLGGIFFMFWINPKLSSMLIVIIVLLGIGASIINKKIRSLVRYAESAKMLSVGLVVESIINYKVIRAFNAKESMIRHFSSLSQDYQIKMVRRLQFRSIFFASIITTLLIIISFLVWYGNLQVQMGLLSSGSLVSFLFYAFISVTSFGGVIEVISNLDQSIASCSRIFSIISLAPEYSEEKHIKLDEAKFIEFHDIIYSFNTKDTQRYHPVGPINLKIELGKFNVIVGKSGCGKTTILNLLLGIYQPNQGEFRLGKTKYNAIYPSYWEGCNIAYVPQEPMLFEGTIMDNISLFASDPRKSQISEIIKGMEMQEFIQSLPDGILSNIGSLSSKLSGGQKQRIAIARALYHDPDILVIDEATNQLDELTESKILTFLLSQLSSKTIICAAHGSRVIARADIVINLDNSITKPEGIS